MYLSFGQVKRKVQGGDVMAYSLIAVQTDGDYAITGEDIKDAYQDYNQENKPSVTVQMKSYGAGVLERLDNS